MALSEPDFIEICQPSVLSQLAIASLGEGGQHTHRLETLNQHIIKCLTMIIHNQVNSVDSTVLPDLFKNLSEKDPQPRHPQIIVHN